MVLDAQSLALRLLIAVLLFHLLEIAIDTFVSSEQIKKYFKLALLVICLGIVFLGGFIRIS